MENKQETTISGLGFRVTLVSSPKQHPYTRIIVGVRCAVIEKVIKCVKLICCIGCILAVLLLNMEPHVRVILGFYWGYSGIMEYKQETTFRV